MKIGYHLVATLDRDRGQIDADEGRVGQAQCGRDEVYAIAATKFEVSAPFGRGGVKAEHTSNGIEVPRMSLRERRRWVLDSVVCEWRGHGGSLQGSRRC